ncbi:MAG TPA: acyl-CoA thioesterase II [Steroidobacteraceae bacterium]|jgi:acyl-CoA thioesterase-2|nr:acyl-CoA thioesterase II [Steroidobacteraceae bacterium]
MNLLDDLVKVMTLERLEVDLFRGESRDIGSPQVFGGQVLGQALVAATATVEERTVHSLHAYFLRRGDFNSPIVYEVDRAMDGKHFASRRVIAIQHGRQIFNMSASFQSPESGLDHQLTMPAVPPPEDLIDLESHYRAVADRLSSAARRVLEQRRPFEFRPARPPPDPLRREKTEPLKYVWFRAVGALPDDEALHRCMLAYVSDFHLLDTALRPHGVPIAAPELVIASIDHAMWFHRSVRVDDWLLYAIDSPSASGARGFTRGSVFSRDGRLVSSAAQEGLIRIKT